MVSDVGSDPSHSARQQKAINLCFALIVIGGFLCFGLGLEKVNNYGDWSDAVEGQCMYNSGIKVSCSGKKSCGGKRPAHIYFIRNTSDAFDVCTTSKYVEDNAPCTCPGNDIPPRPPSGQNGEWRTCYVRNCNADGMRFDPFTEEDYNNGVIMVTFGLLMFICPYCLWYYMGSRDKYIAEQKQENEQRMAEMQSEGNQSQTKMDKKVNDGDTKNETAIQMAQNNIGESRMGVTVAIDDEISVWLKRIGQEYYEDYYGLFIQNGFYKTDVLRTLNDDSLKNLIGIEKMGHRRKILMEIQKMGISY